MARLYSELKFLFNKILAPSARFGICIIYFYTDFTDLHGFKIFTFSIRENP
jgi:hypothetical protein